MPIRPVLVALALVVSGLLASPSSPSSPPSPSGLTAGALDETLRAVPEAGVYGTYSAVVDGGERWEGAAGVADVGTGRPMAPDLVHRVGSVTKTFTAVAVLQLVGEGRVGLDASVAEYLPELLAEGLDPGVTVRMLLNQTSGLAEYLPAAFPSLAEDSTASLAENRLVEADPWDLVRLGLAEPVVGAPGERFFYSNTNYVIAGLLLERVTGTTIQRYLAEHVFGPAGLRDTRVPDSPFVEGPHARLYESWFGLIDPPRDYSVYSVSWVPASADLVATMGDLTRFYAALFDGTLLDPAQLEQMLTTVAVEGAPEELAGYGLGLMPWEFSCGTFWGHGGTWLGAFTMVFGSADGQRQVAVGTNLERYQTLDEAGSPLLHPADVAVYRHLEQALCGAAGASAPVTSVPWLTPVAVLLP